MNTHLPFRSRNPSMAAGEAVQDEDHPSRTMEDLPPRSRPISIPAPPGTSQTGSSLAAESPPGVRRRSVQCWRAEKEAERAGQDERWEAETSSESAAPEPSIERTAPISGTSRASDMQEFGVPLMLLDDADTLVYIDPPPSFSVSVRSSAVPHRIHSQNLLKTGSAVWRDLLGPRKQARVLRRRGLTGNLPEGIRYVLDLTPALEDDEAVIYMTELSCPEGIRTWSRGGSPWSLPLSRVGGQEDLEWLPAKRNLSRETHPSQGKDNSQFRFRFPSFNTAPPPPYPQQEDAGADILTSPDELVEEPINEPEPTRGSPVPEKVPGLPLDYSPVRHRSCIERVLHALEGLDPRLDTPPKLWTFFALAKLFEVATEQAVCDYILSWLYTETNTLFIELHPEVTYRIAGGIQCTPLCRKTFAILVGEEALLLLHHSKHPTPKRPRETLHGRVRETLDDEELQRIEYASKTFMERILSCFVDLVGTEMRWLGELKEFQKIGNSTPRDPRGARFASALTFMLKEFIRDRICSVLRTERQTYVPKPHEIISSPGWDYPRADIRYVCPDMRPLERILSRTFWMALLSERFCADSNEGPYFPPGCVTDLGSHLPALKGQQDAIYGTVRSADVHLVVSLFNDSISYDSETVTPFVLSAFMEEAGQYVMDLSRRMLESPRSVNGGQLELTDTLACLNEDEFQYLPLWAGGNDDGTGGVFTDHGIPIVEHGGFSAPGPNIHTGSTAASSESFSMVDGSEGLSTAQMASRRATDGHAAEVMSMDSLWEDVMVRRDNGRERAAGSLGAGGYETVSESLNEDDIAAEIASDSSDTIMVSSPSLVDPLNDEEELDLEEGEPDNISSGEE